MSGSGKPELGLKKTLNWKELLSIGLGAVVGWSWIIYSGFWSTMGGSMGGVIGFLITGLLCSFVGLCYGELSSMYPKAGGEVVYVVEAFGQKMAIFTQWLTILLWTGLLMVECMMIPVILVGLGIPLPQWVPLYQLGGDTVYLSYLLCSLVFNAVFAFINILGAKISGRAQKWAVYIMLAAAVFFCASGVIGGEPSNAEPLFTDVASLTFVLLMLPGFLSGFQAIPQAAEEGAMPHKMVGRVVVMAVWGSVIFYLLVVIGLAFAAPASVRGGDGLVVVEAVNLIFNGNFIARLFVTLASLLGMLTTWNAAYIASSRLVMGLGRAKLLPSFLGDLHPKFGTPYKALIVLFIASSLIIFAGTNQAIYIGIVNSTSFGTVISWLLVTIAFLVLRKKYPTRARPYKVKWAVAVGVISIVFCVGFLSLYLPIGPSSLTGGEWLFLGVYAVIALVISLLWHAKKGKMSLEERKKLMGITEMDIEESQEAVAEAQQALAEAEQAEETVEENTKK